VPPRVTLVLACATATFDIQEVSADGMRAGDEVESYRTGIPKDLIASMGGVIDPGMLAAKTAARGNCLPIHMVPLGQQIFNLGQ